jgi:hypothetical protein
MSGQGIVDPYAEAAALIARLNAMGRTPEAARLQDAIDSGSTGTEVFMALRWHLRNMLEGNLQEDVEAKASALEAYLAKALR